MSPVTPDWYPDPYGRHESRYWDGTRWTVEVSDQGVEQTETPIGLVTLESMASRDARAGVLVGHRQTIATLSARVANALGLYFFFIASGLLMAANSATKPPSEGYVRWISWVFDYTSGRSSRPYACRIPDDRLRGVDRRCSGGVADRGASEQRIGLQFGKAGRANPRFVPHVQGAVPPARFCRRAEPEVHPNEVVGRRRGNGRARSNWTRASRTTDSDVGVGVYIAVLLGVLGAISFLLIRPPRHPRHVVVANTGVLLVEVDGQLRPALLDTLTDRGTLKSVSR